MNKIDSVRQDLRYALRTLRRESGFALFTILIVGLGVAASATVFSVLNSVLVKPLPFKDPASLVWMPNKADIDGNMSGQTIQVNRMLDWRARNQSFTGIAGYFAFYGVGDLKLTGEGEPERLSAVPVSQNFFPLLGVSPQIGRQFTEEESRFNAAPVAMLTDGFWKRRFAGDHTIVGKTIRLNGQSANVVGVLPPSFDFGAIFAPGGQFDLFYPFPLTDETDRQGNTMALIGRLKPGVDIRQAQAESDILGNQISDEHRNQNDLHPALMFLREHVSGQIRPALWILGSAVGVVMLIVIANLSNLMLARTAARRKEMAIRSALGAGRARLIRQLLTEGLLLTTAGAILGLLLTVGATRAIAHLTTLKVPLLSAVHVDGPVLAFTVLVSMVTGLVLGISPALQLSGLRLSSSLGRRAGGATGEQAWLRGALVVSEIAFACVLLVGAGLLMRSFLRLLDVRMGFRPESAVSLRIDLASPPEKLDADLTGALHRIADIPGVTAVGITDALPLGKNRTWDVGAKGKTYSPGSYPSAYVHIVSEGYVRAMGMSLRQGRDFREGDNFGSARVMLINETAARRLWPGENPVGKQASLICGDRDVQVVGVVSDVRHMALEKDSGGEMYLPMRQCTDTGSSEMVIRSSLPLPVLAGQVDAALRPIMPNLPKGGIRPLTDLVDRAVSPRRFIVLLLTGFAAFALVLASLGIYGLISYSVSQRTQEIGIRMALGASTFDVQRRIVLRTLWLAALGLGSGALGSLVLARWVKGLLFGVTAEDPMTFAAAAALLITIAALAGYLPARRASRIDPMICLRSE